MQQWEYESIELNRKITKEELNNLGASGWELCDHTVGTYIFKRAIPQPSTVSSIVGKAFNEVEKEVESRAPSCYDPRVDHRD